MTAYWLLGHKMLQKKKHDILCSHTIFVVLGLEQTLAPGVWLNGFLQADMG